MESLLKKTSIIIAFITIFIIAITLIFVPKTVFFSSIIEKLNLKESTEEELSLDNWELSTVFYDSTVDDGKTPLTEINWDASDGSYKEGETRVITVQIYYKNTNAVTTYQPGELEISIPNLIYTEQAQWSSTAIVGANDTTHTGYDWNFITGESPTDTQKEYYFTNKNIIEEKTNFEGSIQIIYTITPKQEENYNKNKLEEYLDECTHTYTSIIKASLKSTSVNSDNTLNDKIIKSNEITLNYIRIYTHPWQRQLYTIKKYANKIKSLDLLSSDYIWIKYDFNISDGLYNPKNYYPYILPREMFIKENIPDDCIVLNKNLEKMTIENGVYKINIDLNDHELNSYNRYPEAIYVGYPKTKYNEENNNLEIKNTSELYANYPDIESTSEYDLLDTSEILLNLTDFEFTYTGNLYSISKTFYGTAYYESMTGKDSKLENNFGSTIETTAKYTEKQMDVKIGDDLLYITDSNGDYRKLNSSEYYYTKVEFPYKMLNGHGITIKKDKYEIELWIKSQNDSEYTLYDTFRNRASNTSRDNYSWSFTKEQHITEYYFIIKNLEESVTLDSELKNNLIINNCVDISQNGTIYNFAYIQVYIDGELQNEPDLNSYSNKMTQLEIAKYDQDTYGTYMQRGYSSTTYSAFSLTEPKYKLVLYKSMLTTVQDDINNIFIGSSTLRIKSDDTEYSFWTEHEANTYSGALDINKKVVGYEIWELLPNGMELTSNEKEIINSIVSDNDELYVFDEKGKTIKQSDFITLLKSNATIEITKNYKNTGRTYLYIKIDLTNSPIMPMVDDWHENEFFRITYGYSISYDAFIEHGSNWTSRSYAKYYNREFDNVTFKFDRLDGSSEKYEQSITDDGKYSVEEVDINKNGITSERLAFAQAKTTITSVVSTHQDTTTYVQTDKSNYSTGVVKASYGSNYEYKLRARTGSSDVTNLILYTNIEEGHNGRGHWKGEFLGIDTTYAESKGYTIKTYYSEKTNATNMKDDTSWKEYTDNTDKTKVKSLAFVFLDSEEKTAILPANSLVYILIQMKAPINEKIKTLAYNNSWTEWNAIDSLTKEPVDFITGINSNTVKVSLPNSVQYEDIEINLEKIWKDNNNELGLRPNEITYKLISNSDTENATEIVLNKNDISLTDSNKWSKTIEVPKYDDEGEVIVYTIDEITPTLSNGYAYIKTIDNLSITNELGKTLTITKKWIDNKNSYLTRPSKVVINVLQNNKEYKKVTITGDYTTNEWSNSIIVPIYDNESNKYNYELEEIEVENYSSEYDSSSNTFTNILSGEERITISKKWEDNSNSYNTRPSSIVVQLKQNNQKYKTITLSGTTNIWKSEEIIVPKYDNNGIKYSYTIEENIFLNNYGLIEYDQNNYTITNTLKHNIDITITKNWVDIDNSYNTRPKELKITLQQNGKSYKTISLSGTTNTWTISIEVPKYDNNQKEYKYTIKEIDEGTLSDYKDITYGEDGLSVTNKLKKDTDLIIRKKWLDKDNEYKTRPNSVKINLYQNNNLYKKLELSGDTNIWTATVEKVPVYDENGKKYSYAIEESESPDKYQKTTYNQTTLTVTNELTEIPKVTLYFTVKNGYTTNGDGEVKFDSEGLNEILKNHNINPDDEYLYEFELENTKTKEIYTGKLSTQGVLEFPDLPFGTYRAIESDDEYFDFVKMINLEEIPGVKFTADAEGGMIEITPTGEDIIYGVNVVNKISMPVENVETTTGSNIIIMIIIIALSSIIIRYLLLKEKNLL